MSPSRFEWRRRGAVGRRNDQPRHREHGTGPFDTIRILVVLIQGLAALIAVLKGCGLT